MIEREPLHALSREDLLALVAELQRQIAELRVRQEALRAEIDQLKRGGKRQAAPFSKGTRTTAPKSPGRKPGAGTFCYRKAPPPEAVTEPPVDVKVLLESCPACGGPLAEERVDFAYRTDLPERPRPKVTQYRVRVCRCTVCGTQVRGQHPDLAPDQYGATAHRLGARVMAAAHALHYGVGIPVRKVPAVLAALTGVQLTQGALTQDALRRTQGPVGTAYEALRTAVPAAPVVHTDDTGWRVGGEPAHLMAFATDAVTVDQIRPRHRHDEVQEVIPADDPGVMVTDRGRRDDAQAFDNVRQQKCLAHIQRSISAVLATKAGRGRDFGEGLKALLQDALQLWHAYHDGTATDFVTEAKVLQEELTYQLRDRRLRDADNQRLLNELGWHHDRGNLVRFLTDPRVEPTNNRAERALRPAVIARKVSQCSKNGRGAYAVAIFTSVVRTLTRQSIDSLVEGLYHLFRTPSIQGIPP
ncbi:MAG: IS66 family transposase [Acidobacteria bacterium]|nr:MAG: IS66 family transposase [Acidobacteriota bacterium]